MDCNKRIFLKTSLCAILTNSLSNQAWSKQKACGEYSRLEFVYPFGAASPFYRICQKFIELIYQNTACSPLVLSKSGANGLIASNYVREKNRDVSRVLISSTSTSTLNSITGKDKNIKDLEPLGLLFRHPQVMVCKGDIKSFNEFLKIASKREMKMSTTGIGGVFDLLGKAYAREFGFKVLDVPYQNNHLLPLFQGEVDFTFVNMGQAFEYFNQGIATPLLRTGGNPLALLPSVRSVSEFFPYLEFEISWGLMADSSVVFDDMKNHITTLLSNEAFFKSRELEMMAKQYGLMLPRTGSPQMFQQYLSSERRLFTEIIRKINFKAI